MDFFYKIQFDWQWTTIVLQQLSNFRFLLVLFFADTGALSILKELMILEVASYEFITLGVYGVTISVAFGIDSLLSIQNSIQ
jgi:hypothetical protein